MGCTVGIILRNLATTSNFVEFRDCRNFMFFKALGVVRDTWHIMSCSRGAMCRVQNESNMSSNGTHERHVATSEWVKIHGRWIRDKGNPKVGREENKRKVRESF